MPRARTKPGKPPPIVLTLDERRLSTGVRRLASRAEAEGWTPGAPLHVDIVYPRPVMTRRRIVERKLRERFGDDLVLIVDRAGVESREPEPAEPALIEDEAIEDEAIEDETIEDETIEDETIEDEAVEDETIEDEAVED